MDLNSKTKISELLDAYPFLKGFLMELNPGFKALDNPVLKNTIGRVATLEQAAAIGGMDPADLIDRIAAEIKKQTCQGVCAECGRENREGGQPPQEGRQEILKGIIKDLHKGVPPDLLKKRLLDLLKEVSPYEIAQMEQSLISEGMPEQEVKGLCNVHVEVFRESLDKKTPPPGLPAGHPVHTFMLENRAAEKIMREMDNLKDPSGLPKLLDRLAPIERHYARKENQLFPVLEAKGISGPSKVMWALHDDIRAMLKHLSGKSKMDRLSDLELKTLFTMINDMIYKEENILFPMALETLTDEDWLRVKKGEEEIGYAWLEAVEDWKPSGSARQTVPAGEPGTLNPDKLSLDTGSITAEQVNLILTHLPVDVSFVNEDDEVVYYSATKDRIFPRSPGVIGRKVQNCHPVKSVGTVQNILDAFRSGRRDSADFWIQMNGRFLYIRYFAVRDREGKYRGALEVSQDVTAIRGLAGEQRLLNWE
ncbi:MAG: DUF438 domain-containing protein [Nitrospiraceae bacterium]|nr:DUF438 domain-containing protein [Nitrospiraceae bacterium]